METKDLGKYIEGIGRRKTATARVRIYEKNGNVTVNGMAADKHFPTLALQKILDDAFKAAGMENKFAITALISGGGIHAQAEAFRHGLARILTEQDDTLRPALKKEGYLKRDPRMKERKKFGHKKARKSPQWSKR